MKKILPQGKRKSTVQRQMLIQTTTNVVKLSAANLIESWLFGLGLGFLVLALVGSVAFFSLFKDRIYPGISIEGVAVDGLTTDQAVLLLEQEVSLPAEQTITLQVDDISISTSSSSLELSRDWKRAVGSAYEVGRVGFPLTRIVKIAQLSFQPLSLTAPLTINQEVAGAFIDQLASLVDDAGVLPEAQLLYSGSPGSLKISPGSPGRQLDKQASRELFTDTVLSSFSSAKTKNSTPFEQANPTNILISAKVASISAQLSDEQVIAAQERAKKLVGQQLIFRAEHTRVKLDDTQLISLLRLPEGYHHGRMDKIVSQWSAVVNQPASDAEFEYDPTTLAVTTFNPGRNGLELNTEETTQLLTSALTKIENETPPNIQEIALPVSSSKPKRELASTNNLGISELIGFGESEYIHSIPSRIHNVSVATKKINNYIVAPGAQFSFNDALGDVSSATGYQPAYVIKGGQTVLGDGGGVCQVSTTLFRALLNSGLNITKRRAHSYRVSYYELNAKPGLDATVYSGDVDLRFINDTKHHVLIHAEADSKNLYMKVELYGTSDGRTTEIKDHVTWDARPALPTQYIPDPSLAPGQKKQVDWSVGGIKAKFTHIIRDKDGNVLHEQEYYSNYIPWAAKYLVGV